MATNTDQPLTTADVLKKNYIEPGSKAHQALLESGYGMTVEKAKQIIKERKENPLLWPYDLYEKAENMLAALNAKPQVIDQTPGWRRPHAE